MTDLNTVLAGLPQTADGIHELLQEKGIKGLPGEHAHCPIANYVRHELGWDGNDNAQVSVGPTVVRATCPPAQWPKAERTPYAVCVYLKRFDTGRDYQDDRD